MPGSARSTGSSSPTAWASSAEPCSDAAIGSSVNSRCSHAPAIVSSARRLVVTFSMPSLTICWAAAGSPLASSMASPRPADEVADDRRVVLEVPGGDDQVGRHELPVRPELGLVQEDLAAAFVHQAGGPRLGHPGAVELAGLERGQRVGVVLRGDRHVAAAARVGLEALLLEPRPQGHVLGVAERRRGQLRRRRGRPASSMPSRTTSDAPPDVVPATMRSASPPERA